jgi:hypothetical protein
MQRNKLVFVTVGHFYPSLIFAGLDKWSSFHYVHFQILNTLQARELVSHSQYLLFFVTYLWVK